MPAPREVGDRVSCGTEAGLARLFWLGADEGLLSRWRRGVVFHDEHVGGIGAQRNAVFFKGLEDSAAEFAEDGVFLVDAHAHADRIGNDTAGDGIYSGNIRIGLCHIFEGGIVADGERSRAEDAEDFVGIGSRVDGKGEGGDSEVAGEVRDGCDLRVWDEVEGAVGVAQGREPKAEVYHRASKRGELDRIADVELVLDENEDSVQHVLEKGLGAETYADSNDAGGGDQRGEVDPQDGQDVEQDDETDDAIGGGTEDSGQGAELVGPLGMFDVRVGQAAHAVDEKAYDAHEDKCDKQDNDHSRQIVVNEGQGVVVPISQDVAKIGFVLRGEDEKEHYGEVSVCFAGSFGRQDKYLSSGRLDAGIFSCC